MHHANLLVGDFDWAKTVIPEDFSNEHVDVKFCVYERFGIAEARALILEAQRRPFEKDFRTFIIAAKQLPLETQNALLKLFEDPSEYALFYLVVQNEDVLIPTLRSRLFLLGKEPVVERKAPHFADFMKLTYGARLTLIAKRVKENDSEWIQEILKGAEVYFREKRKQSGLKSVLEISSYIPHQGSSKKMLLEHLAITL